MFQKSRRSCAFILTFSLACLAPLVLSAQPAGLPGSAFVWAPFFSVFLKANQFEINGQFIEASNALNQATALDLSNIQRKKVAFELDRLHRIRLDFPFTQDTLYAALQKSVKSLTTNEFNQWVQQGRFDVRTIDGQKWYMASSVANLFFRYPELNPRRINGPDHTQFNKDILASCRAIKQAALQQGTPYVLPKRFDVTMTVTADADVVPAGQIIRAWLPLPHMYPYQTNFELISSSPTAKDIAPGDSPIRSIYFEQAAKAGQPTVFTMNYRYTHYGVWFDIDPKRVTPFDGKDPAIAAFTQQAPNVVFTPDMKELSLQIVGNEKNPAVIARKIYDWIGANIHYSFATEYSTIRNISDYCRAHGYGDCGQEAMLFITLCRLNGIPARWQTGWHTFPGGKDIHDWTEIYLAPYGWVPVDPYMSVMSSRYATTLTPDEQKEIRDFYFGGLDHWRIAANGDHNQELAPPKNTLRSDNVDFQRGELESGSQNIYFDHYNYQLDAKEVSPDAPK